jgi:hypothetical protein
MNAASKLDIHKGVRCSTCSFGRAPQRGCDIFGTQVKDDRVCRCYRRPAESHTQSRAANPILDRLHPGIVYEVATEDGTSMYRAVYRLVPVTREEPATTLDDKWERGHSIEVLNIDGSRSPAQLNRYESGLLILTMRDLRYAASGDPWSAIQSICAQMAVDGRIPLVNGSNRNACITSMAWQFGEGTAIWLAEPHGPGSEALIVDPLGNDHVTDPVFPAEQEVFMKSFQSKW